MRESIGGQPVVPPTQSALDVNPIERNKIYEDSWKNGGLGLFGAFTDLTIDERANETVAEFIRSKISKIVHDSEVAQKLMPYYYYGTKRPIIDTNYYETYNRENVSLVDVKNDSIESITPNGLKTKNNEYELDVIIFATGYDGMTGPLMKIDIKGKDGISLKEKWDGGAQTRTYLGIANA
ncbi:hypothetical protein BED47_02120 [Gottfriedia luciferensis]|uniref:Flavin-containing monooxygenase n=2 Tax=Bacillaceae TaxID=186817 RepID=A0ABX3A024_9BACI|nr:hypothetical protein [Gottfriedia luciferensis]ODG93989.1 hypothetical protein BED47_02120 [Gottfriedia luciferensis]